MALVFMEGFDKYGPLNATSGASYVGQEWNANSTNALVAGLSATGSALNLTGSGASVLKALGANYSRLIGGYRFATTFASGCHLAFMDSATIQADITVTTGGLIQVRNGSGAVLQATTVPVLANSVHYLEYDITFGNTAAYQVWLDGTSILSGTGDTTNTANNFTNGIRFAVDAGGSGFTVDDVYVFDATGTTNNAVLLTSPRIETQFPNSDAAVQFGIGAATLGVGGTVSRGSTITGSNFSQTLLLRPLTPVRGCTLNSISFLPAQTSGTANYRVCVYADNGAGAPGALIGSSGVFTGYTNLTVVTQALTTPVALTGGSQYWLGITTDSGTNNLASDGVNNQGRCSNTTFAGGPPSTAPAMVPLTQVFTPLFWGGVTNTTANFYEISQNPASGNLSYIFDATVGHEDLYGFPAMVTPPTTIYGVAVKANIGKSDSGAKTVSVRCKSGATDSAGSVASITPGVSYGWATSLFPTDPATGAAWTLSGLNAAQAGLKIET